MNKIEVWKVRYNGQSYLTTELDCATAEIKDMEVGEMATNQTGNYGQGKIRRAP